MTNYHFLQLKSHCVKWFIICLIQSKYAIFNAFQCVTMFFSLSNKRFNFLSHCTSKNYFLSTYFLLINSFRHGPGGDDVVHDPLRQRLRHLVKLHELAHAVENVVVLGRGGSHLLDDRSHVTEDGGVQQGWKNYIW